MPQSLADAEERGIDPPSWADAAIPSCDEAVLRDVLERRSRATPDATFVVFEDGHAWSYADALGHARRAASGLAALGVARGDVVSVLLPNGPHFLKAWFGANLLGAAIAPFNTQYRGGILRHLLDLSAARIAIVDADFVAPLRGLRLETLETLLVVGGEVAPDGLAAEVAAAEPILDAPLDPALPRPAIDPADTQFIIFTSGTTGPSKGVIVPYVQMQAGCLVHFEGRFGAGDRYLVNMPLFHITGTLPVFGAMLTGGTAVLAGPFRTGDFWDTIRRHRVTGCTMVGAVAGFLEACPPRADDADNPLRWVSMFPLVKEPAAFGRRFGVSIFTAYGMSELSMPIVSDPDPARPDSCGRLRAGYRARLVDADDRDVAEGDVGELILRADRPHAITPGYWRDRQATAAAWRGGWFHTGDLFRRDARGLYYFIDRGKDSIRRRGENISSFEVELEALAHPAVAEAAAVAVPSPHGEDEVMLVAVRAAGLSLGAAELRAFLAPRMARFMLPRYIRFVDALPRTPTLRVQKHLLRAEGVTADSWDHEREKGC